MVQQHGQKAHYQEMFTYMTDNLQQIHDDWKNKGFPYYPKNEEWRNEIFNQLVGQV